MRQIAAVPNLRSVPKWKQNVPTPTDVSSSSSTTPTSTITTITALPDTVNLNLYAGDDFQMSLTLTNPDGSNTSLLGATVQAQIRSQPGSTIIASFTPTISGNVVTLALLGTSTQSLTGTYDWDCQITSVTLGVWTLVAGDISFTPDITR